jgi:signal transduction histidine kinase
MGLLHPVITTISPTTAALSTASRIVKIKNRRWIIMKTNAQELAGILVNGIAHDFNNVLGIMLANISLAKQYKDDQTKLLEKMEDIEKVVHRARELSQQLLHFAKNAEPFKKILNIRDLLQEGVRLAVSGVNITYESCYADDLWLVEVDEMQINQVIYNMAINAVQAMPMGGKITIRARNFELANHKKEYSPALPEGKYVVFSIKDEGFGIPPAYLPKIFDFYFSTTEKGNGLGLAITHAIIQKHNGFIEVESECGEGTTFHVYIPAFTAD